jgi:2-oxoglutarate ferredoxin oxidoreductase subunit beta
MRPEVAVFTVQGDGDMVSEGLAEILHAAARGERIVSFMLNNGVFGDTGGQMTAATVVGQRTKTSLDGRAPDQHGYPVPIANLIAECEGAAYVARGAVYSPATIAKTEKMMRRAFEVQAADEGFVFLEILTMCPTGWFLPTLDGPGYLSDSIEARFPLGELPLARNRA